MRRQCVWSTGNEQYGRIRIVLGPAGSLFAPNQANQTPVTDLGVRAVLIKDGQESLAVQLSTDTTMVIEAGGPGNDDPTTHRMRLEQLARLALPRVHP